MDLSMFAGRYGYDTRSQYQREMASPLFQLLSRVASTLNNKGRLGKNESLVVVDCGSSQGGLTKDLLAHFMSILTKPCPIHIVLCDTYANDWETAFKNMQQLVSETPSVNLTYSGIGKSFYQLLLPPSSVTLVVTSSALHWLSRIPNATNVWINGAEDNEQLAVEQLRLAENDWKEFLDLRGHEVKSGGFMVISVSTREDGNDFPGMCNLNSVLRELVAEKQLSEDFMSSYALPLYYMSSHQCLEVIKTRRKDWILRHSEIKCFSSPFWTQYKQDGNAERFATDTTELYVMGFTQPLLKKWFQTDLNRHSIRVDREVGSTDGQVDWLLQETYRRLEVRLSRNPIDFTLHRISMLLERL